MEAPRRALWIKRKGGRLNVEQLSYKVIGAAIIIHGELGPGLLESAYEACLEDRLRREGLYIERQKELPLRYNGVRTKHGYRVDLLVEKCLIVEVKAQRDIALVDTAQLNTYLRLLNCKLGLLINFNVRWLKTGIHRIINPYFVEPRPPSR